MNAATKPRQISRNRPAAAPAPAPKPEPERDSFDLAGAVPTRREKPIFAWVYGKGGIGKTTLASQMGDNPIFLSTEDGQHAVDATQFPTRPRTFVDVLRAIRNLTVQPHTYDTLVIDTLDGVEPLIWKTVVETTPDDKGRKVTSIEGYGYQKGFFHALEHWRHLLAVIERLQEKRGMNVVLISHEVLRGVKLPDQEDYERFEPAIHKQAVGLVHDAVDYVLFATKIVITKASGPKGKGRVKGSTDGVHYLLTKGSAGFLAKQRTPLPEELEVDGAALYASIRDNGAAMASPLIQEVTELMSHELVDDDTYDKAAAYLERHGKDVGKLTALRGRLLAFIADHEAPPDDPAAHNDNEAMDDGEAA